MSLFENYNTGDDSASNNRAMNPPDYLGNWGAQTFTPTISHRITSVKLKLYRNSTPGTVTVSIRATDGDGAPTGSDLASGTTDGDTLTTDTAGEWREITLGAGYNLVGDTKYAILHRNPGEAVGISYWRADTTSPTYSGGSYFESDEFGAWTEYLTDDMMFEEYGETDTGAGGSFASVGASGAIKRKRFTTYQEDLADAIRQGWEHPMNKILRLR